MPAIMTKDVPFLECKANMDKRTFSGFASTWDLDSKDDVVVRGAFAKTLQDRGPRDLAGEVRSRIKILWMHDPWTPIGLPTKMEEQERGLFVEGRISKTPKGDEVLELMRDGTIDVMSIGYNTVKHEFNAETEIRYLLEVKLFEFSPVTFAANENAEILRTKTAGMDGEFLAWFRTLGADELKALQGILKTCSNVEDLKDALSRMGRPPAPSSEGGGNTGAKGEPRESQSDPPREEAAKAFADGIQSLLDDIKKSNERR